jgi:Protein of unknown function (DUF2911)
MHTRLIIARAAPTPSTDKRSFRHYGAISRVRTGSAATQITPKFWQTQLRRPHTFRRQNRQRGSRHAVAAHRCRRVLGFAGSRCTSSSFQLPTAFPQTMRLHCVGFAAATALFATSSLAQGPMRAGPSGRATTAVELTFVDSVARAAAKPALIRVDYGQPHLRGRALLTDSLVPYGAPWRLGANGATTLTTDVDLVLGGAPLAHGTYVLQALPTRDGWKLLVQKPPVAQTTPVAPPVEVARVDLRSTALPVPMESLSIALIPSRAPGTPSGELRIVWGTVVLSTTWSQAAGR